MTLVKYKKESFLFILNLVNILYLLYNNNDDRIII
jgi:hypothetical protein